MRFMPIELYILPDFSEHFILHIGSWRLVADTNKARLRVYFPFGGDSTGVREARFPFRIKNGGIGIRYVDPNSSSFRICS